MQANDIVKILNKLNHVLEDVQMLRDGTWKPDEDSCNATLQHIEEVINIIENG